MVSLFKTRKKAGTAPNQVQDQIARNIVETCLRIQTRWAVWMQRKINPLPVKIKFILLLLFIVLAGGYSLYCLTEGLSTKGEPTFSISPFKQPRYGEPQKKAIPEAAFISREEYQRIHGFRLYIDSLARSPSGKRLFDSIITAHPGLLDSILFIEHIYNTQTQK
jgi:hypothetical protein